MTEPDVLEIHTSDRVLYKRCRRRFQWGSTLRDNLVFLGQPHKHFFWGTGFHFALEDYHGWQRFEHPALAFAAYYDAQDPDDLPDEADEVLETATGMLEYYIEDWLHEHPEPYETLWVDDKPQVEVEIAVDLTGLLMDEIEHQTQGIPMVQYKAIIKLLEQQPVHYVITLDRVVIDKHDRIWGLDYKTAASFDELNLQTNPQIGSYDWAGHLFYEPAGYRWEGMWWQQHRKAVPHPPKVVNVGKKNEGISLDAGQATTWRLYRKALKEYYGKMSAVPEAYAGLLAMLANVQDDSGDQFIRREPMRRNQHQREVEQAKIVQEVLEMLNPDLPMYPNPTKDCGWDCPFKNPCLALDDGSDVQFILDNEYIQWKGYRDEWRAKIAAIPASTKP